MVAPSNKLSLGAGKAVVQGLGQLPMFPTPVSVQQPDHGDFDGDIDTVVLPPQQPVKQSAPSEDDAATQLITLSGVSAGKPVFNTYPFETLKEGQRVYLRPDPLGSLVKPDVGHPDQSAISVQDAPTGGRHIGYIPAKTAKVYTNIFNTFPSTRTIAKIYKMKGGIEGYSWGVDVEIKFLEN